MFSFDDGTVWPLTMMSHCNQFYAFVKKISKVFSPFGCHGTEHHAGNKKSLKSLKDHTRIITVKFDEIPLSGY